MALETEVAMSALDAEQNALDMKQKALEHAQASSGALDQPWTQDLVQFLSIGVFGFSCFALILATFLLWRSGASAHQVLRVFGVISIINFSALLLIVGYNSEQLTPIVGLFGAIAGYLLGKDSSTGKNQ